MAESTKRCSRCGEEKPYTEFHRNNPEALDSRCKECNRIRLREWREANRERARAQGRAYQKARIAQGKKRLRNRERDNARGKVAYEIRMGRLVPGPCKVCGESPTGSDGRTLVQAHHEDYRRPLDVMWLCSSHHKHLHAGLVVIVRPKVTLMGVLAHRSR